MNYTNCELNWSIYRPILGVWNWNLLFIGTIKLFVFAYMQIAWCNVSTLLIQQEHWKPSSGSVKFYGKVFKLTNITNRSFEIVLNLLKRSLFSTKVLKIPIIYDSYIWKI